MIYNGQQILNVTEYALCISITLLTGNAEARPGQIRDLCVLKHVHPNDKTECIPLMKGWTQLATEFVKPFFFASISSNSHHITDIGRPCRLRRNE